MTEREHEKGAIRTFLFVCPDDREEEARELLRGIKGVSASPDAKPTVRLFADPDTRKVVRVGGREISGILQRGSEKLLLDALADAEIAGYSRATQILYPEDEIIPLSQVRERVYRPRLRFVEEGLVVEFDNRLQVEGDQLGDENVDADVTGLLIHPEQEFYAGIRDIPKGVLAAITEGSESYRGDISLTPEQLTLIDLGTRRLKFLIDDGRSD